MHLDNCIVINFPMGAGGHIIGRLLASCKNVKWYDHSANGEYPWKAYTGGDIGFTDFHFNRRFSGASGSGYGDPYAIDPVLDLAKKNGVETSFQQQFDHIREWKYKIYPDKFIYPLHSRLSDSRKLFYPAKHVVVIPNNIDRLVKRYMNTSGNYFINHNNKSITYMDHMISEYGSIESATINIRNTLQQCIDEYAYSVTSDDVIIDWPDELLEVSNFRILCYELDLEFNLESYENVKKFIIEHGGI